MVQLLVQAKASNTFVPLSLEDNIDLVDPVAILSGILRAVEVTSSSDSWSLNAMALSLWMIVCLNMGKRFSPSYH